jgi:periplasmic protein CpxP/Spy
MINYQNRSKVFLVIIAILLIANIALLAFFLEKKGPDKQPDRQDRKAFIANFLQKEIGFNQQQLLQYDTLSIRHREKISRQFENIRNNKTGQFKQLVAFDFSDSSINMVANQSTASQKIIEVNMFNHIKSIRLLCTPEQLPKFDSLFIKVFNRRGEGRKKAEK